MVNKLNIPFFSSARAEYVYLFTILDEAFGIKNSSIIFSIDYAI